jgi:hypothetical protein
VIPAGGGVAAIAIGSFWLGRRSKPSAEGLVYETRNSSKSPNSSAELPESYNGKFCELPVLAEKNHHHFESDPHH